MDAFNRQGNLDGKGNSYAAELVPEEIVSEGVVFRVSNDVERKNVVKCDGQRIVLPQGNYGRVYLLAASPSTANRSVVRFPVTRAFSASGGTTAGTVS